MGQGCHADGQGRTDEDEDKDEDGGPSGVRDLEEL
jgi:hypothetical protein